MRAARGDNGVSDARTAEAVAASEPCSLTITPTRWTPKNP